ncbi:putative DNA binding domain-containing protein [Clostridium tyrobutyricum]|uniref:AlbA family DNA-binding domain-containing protein n=1 Tax=Clostridium tyrobutyricum TaxID=1519 RepID=UPI001C38871D|nr:RNA-binding domain-containing protein [Clostridium tyrobutyricum]MBV4445969.1 putative DNA binding domain-containing protein [Clostridium tyrobutyricum]
MDIKRFLNLLKKSEGSKLDFKEYVDLNVDSGRKELAKDVCAIANSRGGRGYLIVGVEDKTKKITGILKGDLNEEKIQQIVSSRIDPPVPVSIEFINYKKKDIAIINIYDGSQKPYQMRDNGAFYIRRGSTNDTMRKQEIISVISENLTLNSELCGIPNTDIRCLDEKIVNKYFTIQGIDINEKNRIQIMEDASIIFMDKERDKYMITLGGLLVFSKTNNIYLPHNMIKITNRVNKLQSAFYIVQGELIHILDRTEKILSNIIGSHYPIEALNQGIRNVIIYRDYSDFSREIEIVVDNNSIVITSPGILIRKKNAKSFDYIKRNMWIYEKLITLDNKGRFIKSGNGFNSIKKSFKNKGKVKFVNSMINDSFKIIYPGINKFK